MKRPVMLLSLLVPLFAVAQAAAQTPAKPATAPARAAAPAPAQAPAQQALTPEQKAQLDKQNAEVTQAALKVLQMADANDGGKLWDGASVVARQAVSRAEFIKHLGDTHARLGAATQRGAPTITRVRYAQGAAVPAGLYVNVNFPTRFAKGSQPIRELVSFRLDEDNVWRLAGYSLPNAGA